MESSKKVHIGHTFTKPMQLDFVHPTNESFLHAATRMFAAENLGQRWNDGEGWRILEEGCTDEEWDGVIAEMKSWHSELSKFLAEFPTIRTLRELDEAWNSRRV